ncbi:MAG: Crp/Fnr family transcriptional regulator [Clostridiales bacterium]|nr:Crp/Fnr family transcriptional regulator [Clostridiales bacterium]
MTGTAIQKSMDILSTCPLFNGMSPMEIGHLLSQEGCRLVHYPAGSTIPSERGMMMLLTGSVLIEKQSADGRYLRMREVWPPQAINVSALLAQPPREVSRLSTPDGCRAVELSRALVTQALMEGGTFSVNLVEFLLGRVVFLNKKITALSGHTAASRLELYLAENAVQKDGVSQVQLPFSLSEFAEHLCVGRASLYRTLDAMEQQGRIRRKGRTIYLSVENF